MCIERFCTLCTSLDSTHVSDTQVEVAQQESEQWQQECRNLRHQLLRQGNAGVATALVAGPGHVSTKQLLQKAMADSEMLQQRLGVLEDRTRSYEGQLAALRTKTQRDESKIKRLERQLDKKTKVAYLLFWCAGTRLPLNCHSTRTLMT